jgi:hypothetical protein
MNNRGKGMTVVRTSRRPPPLVTTLTILQDKVIARILVEDSGIERERAGAGTKDARVGER